MVPFVTSDQPPVDREPGTKVQVIPMKSFRYNPEETVTRQGRSEYVVLGGGPIGASIARTLGADKYTVHYIDDSKESADVSDHQSDPSKVQSLERANLTEASTVIVSTRSDRRNLLIAQLVRANFDVSRILVLANDPEKRDLFEKAGHDSICATTAISAAVSEAI